MAEFSTINIHQPRAQLFKELLPQIEALISGENDLIANLANISSAIHTTIPFHWIGFYLVKQNELVLGPFQGPPACTRIAHGKGVCGTAWKENKTMLVADVEAFPGHIACSAFSKSEIVVPIHNKSGEVAMVLDVDSEHLNDFSEEEQQFFEEVGRIIERTIA